MEESDDNVSSEDMNCITSPSLKTKPKKRSLVERELETSLTAKITSPISYGESTSTSRYGRARRLKNDVGITDIEKTDLKLSVTHNDMSPTRALSAYKMHASNSPIRTESVKDDLDNQIENIYNENISLSHFGSEEKKSRQSNSKIYIRKDLIQTKDKEETIVLIKNMFSPDRSNISNSDLSKSSEKYNKKHKEDLSSVVKALDFGGKKKKKETQEKRMSQSDLFNLEAQCGYQVGDLTWARMGTYPFWPSIVTREPTSLMFIKKKLIGRLEKDIIHVTFLGDNGRRGWILESMLRKYMGLQEFQFARENFTPEAKKRDPRLYAAFFISEKRQPLWHLSVEEAEVLLKEPKRLRIDILHAMLSKGKDAKEIPVKSKKVVRTNSDVSLSESLYDSLFSEDDCKNSDTECSRSKARNKSFDVSDVVTACLDNMAAKTGITKIQKQSHMDIWLQKAKSKTPEKCQYIQTKCEKKTKMNTKIKVSSRNKNYRLRNQSIESQGERDIEIKLLSHQSEHDYIQSAFTNGHIVDDIDLVDSGSNLSDPGSELSSLSIQENTSTTLYNSVPDNEAKGILTEVTDENCTEIEVITNEDITVESCDINELLIRSERENSGKNNEEAICSDNLSTKSSLIDDFAEENKVNVNQQNPETPQENESVISTNVQIIDNDSSRKDETIEMLNKNVSNPLPLKIVNKCVEDTQSNDKSNLYCTDEAVKILNGNVVHTILFEDNDKSINENTIHNTTNDVSDLSTTDETVKILENVITNSVQKENENSKINHDKNNESASDSNLKDNSSKIPNNCQTKTIFLALAQDDNIANEIIRNKDYNTMSDVSVKFDKHDIIKEQNKNIDSNYSPNEVIHKNILFTQNKYKDKKTSITEQMKDHVGNLILDEQNEGIRENDVSAKNENLLIDDNIQKNCQSVITEFNTEDSCDISLIYEHNSNEGDLNKSNVSKGHLNLISESMSSIGSHCAIINKDVENLTVKRSNLISMETQKIDIMSEHDEKKETDHIHSDLGYSNINGENCQEVNEDVTDTRGNPAESYKSKSPSDSVNGLKNIEFLKYFEQKQDSVIDENPELTDDEVKAYLYKTWQYEESLKSERKILDDIEQSKLVKGLDQPAPEKKYRKKTLRLKSEKSKQTLINFKVVPKDMKTERKQHSLRNDLNSDVTLNSDLNESTAQKEILHNDLINVQTDKNKRDNIPMSHKENIVKLAEESKNHLINDLKNNSSEKILNAHIIPETNSQNIEITKSSVSENEKIKSSYNSNSENEFAIENNSKQVNSKEEVESENCRVENYFDLTLDSDSNDNSSTKKISLNINKKYIENNSNTIDIHCNSKDTIDKDHSKDLPIKNYEKCIDLQYVDVNIINNGYIDSTSECEIRETACSRASTLSSEDFIKKKDDLDVISIKSGESEISLSKRKTRKEKHPPNKTYLENPEFLKYLELRQDELIDENPQLTQEEITTYLYNTWSYEENMKSENKKSDDLDQRNLVKGLNDDPVSVKRIRKKVKVDIEKDYSGNYEEVIPKDKSKRRTERQFYREDYSDYEDELEMYQIFKSESSVKAEPENAVIDETNEKVFVNKVENTEATVVEEEITEHVDQVEEYFRQLTEPKPNLFKGLVREKVCEICEKIGNLVKCKGCYGMFHVDCTKKIVELKESPLPVRGRKKKRKNRGRKPKGLDDSYEEHSDDRSQDRDVSLEYEPESYTIANADEFEQKLSAKLKEMIENPETKYDTHSSDEELNWSDADVGKCQVVDIVPKKKTTEITNFKCKNCEEYDIPICFVCKGAISPKNQIEHRQKCQIAHCNKYYHLECLEHWPQTHLSTGERSKSLSCPRHVCHTCVCDDPRGCKTRFSGDKLARCVRCPATYHSFTKCLPAGTQILTGSHVVCPRHYEHRPGKVPCHVNTGWCFICALGGSLICCEYCPTSFHAECLNIEPPEGGYMCEDCETGCLPLYGEMVWVKLGHYRWWPGLILHPSEIPENILAVKHYPGEYVVRFFGQYDHYWVNRGRVFPFQEGDTGRVSSKNSKIDAAFSMAVQHAQRAYEILKNESPSNEGDEDIASSLLPPRYVKLKVNKPCGSLVHRRADPEEGSLAQCECAPDDGEPCGPYSHCLNRMLLTECGPTCRAGERCSNRAFERRQYPRMEPYRTAARGWGLRTLEDIRAGQFVIEYVGELIDEEEFQRRMRWKHEVRDENYYFLTLDKERMIDAGPKGNLARFMNHSCDPNCETQKWTVLGDVRVGLFALHDIPAKSELTFNYNLECAGIDKKRCMCGARRCSGFMGAKPKQEEPKKSKMAAKRTYKKRKPIELSPSTSYNKPKRGRPRLRELTDIERDLLIITSASNGVSSDSESSRLNSLDSLQSLKRKRVNFDDDSLLSPSTKKTKIDSEGIKNKEEIMKTEDKDGASDRTDKSEVD